MTLGCQSPAGARGTKNRVSNRRTAWNFGHPAREWGQSADVEFQARAREQGGELRVAGQFVLKPERRRAVRDRRQAAGTAVSSIVSRIAAIAAPSQAPVRGRGAVRLVDPPAGKNQGAGRERHLSLRSTISSWGGRASAIADQDQGRGRDRCIGHALDLGVTRRKQKGPPDRAGGPSVGRRRDYIPLTFCSSASSG